MYIAALELVVRDLEKVLLVESGSLRISRMRASHSVFLATLTTFTHLASDSIIESK
jgi:hypothetical protein